MLPGYLESSQGITMNVFPSGTSDETIGKWSYENISSVIIQVYVKKKTQ